MCSEMSDGYETDDLLMGQTQLLHTVCINPNVVPDLIPS